MRKTATKENDEWIPKADAAKRLGLSIRQIENLTAKGRIRKRKMPKAAWEKTGRVVYAAADIDAIRAGERPPAQAPVAHQVGQLPAGVRLHYPARFIARAAEPPAAEPFAGLVQALSAAFPPASSPTYLSLQQAATYSGLPARWLRDAARAGKLRAQNVGVKRERWMFPREGLS